MNERIKELDKSAQEYAGRIAGNDEDSNYVAWFNIYKEKLAELLVREMLQTCEDHPAWTGRMIGEQIKQHFGVE